MGYPAKNQMKKNRGFTLIELLVVIAIIGILAAIVLVSLSGAQNRAKDARIQADMNQIRSSSQLTYTDVGYYDGALMTDDVNTLIADIRTQGGGLIASAVASNAYCFAVQTNNTGATKYWCVDSNLLSEGSSASTSLCATNSVCR